jgi:branched-chain amino acid transport system ATP-binding protein
MALLELDRVSRVFGGLTALADVSFTVNEGEIVGLIGPNGAGKTTALNVISGAIPPSRGMIRFIGREIGGRRAYEIANLGLCRTFQATTVFPEASVLENVMRGAFLRTPRFFFGGLIGTRRARETETAIRQRALRILEEFGLASLMNFPARTLSLGHQRRLGVAIALATEPRLMLLDEPAAGLHPQEAAELGRQIEVIQRDRGFAILLVEHHMRFVMGLCQRIIVLDRGRKIAEGTPQAVTCDPGVIEAYLGGYDDQPA